MSLTKRQHNAEMMDELHTMNCEDYKKAIAADPSESFDGGAAHSSGCASCGSFKAEMLALDARIAKALAIDVPELRIPELPAADDAESSNVVNLPFRRRGRKAPVWLGVAASAAVAAVLAISFLPGGSNYDSLADEVMAHLDHEPRALQVSDERVSERRLDKVVRAKVADVNEEIGLITYARTCVINGNRIPHLVIQGESGPVTLLLMPDEEIEDAIPLDGKGVHGVILPLGHGSIAIIGEREERIGEIQDRVIDSVRWSI